MKQNRSNCQEQKRFDILPNKTAAEAGKIFSSLDTYYILNYVGKEENIRPYLETILNELEKKHCTIVRYDAQTFKQETWDAIANATFRPFKHRIRSAEYVIFTGIDDYKGALLTELKESLIVRAENRLPTLLVSEKPIEDYDGMRTLWRRCTLIQI